MREAVAESNVFPAGGGTSVGTPVERALLTLGGMGALLAGTCCLAPLVLVSLGVSGAWLANFRLLEPYRPVFLGIAVVSLALAWRRLYRPAVQCEAGTLCAPPQARRGYRIGFWAIVVLLAVMVAYPYVMPLFY